MKRVYTLDIDHEKCQGCQSCTIVCAVKRERISNPLLGRIQVARREGEGIYIPVVCNQCEDAPCMSVCPVSAISRNPMSDVVQIDYDKCIGCRYCALACPFGAMLVNVGTGKPMKCDLCDGIEGGPVCVRVCANQAIRYLPVANALYARRQGGADKMLELTVKEASKQ